MSSRKPLRRITSDRGEDNCLSKRNYLESYTRLTLPQLECIGDFCEGRVRVHASRPYIGACTSVGLEKKMQSSKETEITGMEDQNLC